jgi:hypothetical protein
MKKQVYNYEKDIAVEHSQFGNITLSLSMYSDCLFVFVNQTGAVGSIVPPSTFS